MRNIPNPDGIDDKIKILELKFNYGEISLQVFLNQLVALVTLRGFNNGYTEAMNDMKKEGWIEPRPRTNHETSTFDCTKCKNRSFCAETGAKCRKWRDSV